MFTHFAPRKSVVSIILILFFINSSRANLLNYIHGNKNFEQAKTEVENYQKANEQRTKEEMRNNEQLQHESKIKKSKE